MPSFCSFIESRISLNHSSINHPGKKQNPKRQARSVSGLGLHKCCREMLFTVLFMSVKWEHCAHIPSWPIISVLERSIYHGIWESFNKNTSGTSLVALWLRIRLPMQRTQVRSLVQEDHTCCGTTKPVRHNYWACTLEPESHNYWARMPDRKSVV